MTSKLKFLAATLPLAFAVTVFAAEEPKKEEAPAPDWSWTAHVDLNSAYYLRGITNTYGNNKWLESNAALVAAGYPNRGDAYNANRAGDAPESRNPAFSWGFDVTHSSGFYFGYWASQLTYSYEAVGQSYDYYKQGVLGTAGHRSANPNFYVSNLSIENDIYGGYTGAVGDLGYTLGMTYYYYAPSTHSNAPETKFALSYGQFGAAAQTLLDDTVWGNKGDTYWTFTWTKPLPYDISFTANAGYYTYQKEGKFLGSRDTALGVACGANNYFFVNGCYGSVTSANTPNAGARPISGGFRHLILGIAQPIGGTGLTWNAQAIIGGVNRFNIQQDNKLTVGISYAF